MHTYNLITNLNCFFKKNRSYLQRWRASSNSLHNDPHPSIRQLKTNIECPQYFLLHFGNFTQEEEEEEEEWSWRFFATVDYFLSPQNKALTFRLAFTLLLSPHTRISLFFKALGFRNYSINFFNHAFWLFKRGKLVIISFRSFLQPELADFNYTFNPQGTKKLFHKFGG